MGKIDSSSSNGLMRRAMKISLLTKGLSGRASVTEGGDEMVHNLGPNTRLISELIVVVQKEKACFDSWSFSLCLAVVDQAS